jgi:hypothetical protein
MADSGIGIPQISPRGGARWRDWRPVPARRDDDDEDRGAGGKRERPPPAPGTGEIVDRVV